MTMKSWTKSWLLLVVLPCLVLFAPTPARAAGYYGHGFGHGFGHGYYGGYVYYPSYGYYNYPSYYGYGSTYYAPAYSSYIYSCPSPAKVVTVEGGDTVDKLIKELTLRKLLNESGLGAPPPPQAPPAYRQGEPQQGALSPEEVAQLRAILQQLRQQQQEKK